MPNDNPVRSRESARYETFLVLILFLTWGTVFLDRMSQLYLAPYFAPEFRLNSEQIGFLASVTAIAWAVSGFFFGALSDRYGRRRILVPAIFLFSALSWMSGMVQSFTQLITAIIEESSPQKRRGRNVGIVVSAAALVGLSAAPILSTQVAARFGWRWAFFAAGIPGIVMGLLLWKFVREPESGGAHAPGHGRAPISEYLLILRFRNMWLSCLGSAGFMCWLFMLNVFAPLYITGIMHEPGTTAGFLLGAGGLGSFFLSFVFPALSDRIGRRPVLMLLAAMSAVVPLALQVRALYSVPWLLAGILFLCNAGQAIASLIIVLVPAETVPAQFRATAIGLATLAGEVIGATVAPALGGALAEKAGLHVPLLMSAGGMVVLFLAALGLKETRGRAAVNVDLLPAD
jgi:MFS family permease